VSGFYEHRTRSIPKRGTLFRLHVFKYISHIYSLFPGLCQWFNVILTELRIMYMYLIV
jgi:hypothetical protein